MLKKVYRSRIRCITKEEIPLEKVKRQLPALLAVLLVIALAAVAWLLVGRSSLQRQTDSLAGQLTAVQAEKEELHNALTSMQNEMAQVQEQLTLEREAAAELEQNLLAVQDELDVMTEARAEAEAQLASAMEELQHCQRELDAVLAEIVIKPMDDLPGMEDDLPVDDATEEAVPAVDAPAADAAPEDAPADEMPAGEPAAEEFFSDTPVDEPVIPDVVTVYTADELGVAFEAPVEWIIDDTAAEEGDFCLHSAEEQASGRYELLLSKSPYHGYEFHSDAYDGTVQLLGREGVYDDCEMTDGRLQRIVRVRTEEEILYVWFCGPCESFGQLEAQMQPILDSMRLIP